MLKGNPNVDLISFFILRTQDDVSLVPNDEMSLIPFPTRELFEQQLPSFDLIILQNFEYLPYGIGDYLENIRSYVEGGGGLAMLGGPQSFSSGGYYGTPVAAALPVELYGPFDSGPVLDTSRFSPQLTDAGTSHPVTSLRYATDDNARGVALAAAARGREPRRAREAGCDRARGASAAAHQGRQADAGDRRGRLRQGPIARDHDRHAVALRLSSRRSTPATMAASTPSCGRTRCAG